MSPTVLRRILISIPVVVTGCAALNPEGWNTSFRVPPLPPVLVASSTEAIHRECHAQNALACAVRDYDHDVCRIYIPANPPKWLLTHEKRHCDGYDHI